MILLLLVALAGLAAAAFWWRMSRSQGDEEPVPVRPAEVDGELFVLHPSDDPPPRGDRPPPALSVARIAAAVAVTTALLVAVAWLIGLLVKVQLDGYFRSGS